MHPGSILWTLALILCITVYDLDHKNNSMSPWVMAGCRALIYPWAASLSGHAFTPELWIAAGAAYSYTLGLTYAARGAGTGPTTRGPLLVCLFLPALLWGSQLGAQALWAGFLALAVFLAWTAGCISAWFRRSSRSSPAIGRLIAGFCLVDLLAITVVTPFSVAILLLVALLFVSTLKFQKIISGT